VLVVGGTPFFLQHVVVPALPSFHDSFPDLTVDFRTILHLDDPANLDCDLLVLHGWFDARDWVRRELPLMPQVTVAAPAYWKRYGMPHHPRDLAEHNCLCYRNPYGKLLDLWRYRQEGRDAQQSEVIEQVIVRGWLNSNHRDNLLELALGGGGVMRIPQVSEHVNPARGLLVPVLKDWEVMDLPPLAIYFRPEQRRALRVRVFADFVAARLADLAERSRAHGQPDIDNRPAWHHGSSRRASSWLSHR
jgi:DNA-binding transcriptional LysR family regulator